MKALRLLGRVLLVVLVLVACVSALAPAVARAQFAAAGGGGAVDVLAALLGKDVTATSFTATAASGSNGLACTFNGCRIDFGAGSKDHATSNGVGEVIFAGSLAVGGDGESFRTNIIGNYSGESPIFMSSATGGVTFVPNVLTTTPCGTSSITEGNFRVVAASTGVGSKVCVCLKDSAGAFAWENLKTGATGTATTCP